MTSRSFAPEPIAMPETTSRSSAAPDDYLERLESLVLQLNLQLAQVASGGQNDDANYTQWLSQRVIDLSLENMALHQKLQKQP